METKDLKYLLAYVIPILGLLCAMSPEQYYFITPVFAFVILPLFEVLLKPQVENHDVEVEASRSNNVVFDILLYLNFPLIFIVVFLGIYNTLGATLNIGQLALCLFSYGIVLATSGINVAHEIGHRNNLTDHWISRIMLMLSLYMHFHIEHNIGHHKRVATPEDPATALKGEWLYYFWFKSMIGGYLSAWEIENKRVRSKYGRSFHYGNSMIQFHLIQLTLLLAIYFVLGLTGLIFFLIIALSSVLLLESINYVEHYGLLRTKLPNGRYEIVQPHHSWNSDHALGRIMLYELTRHSDHHFKANRKYQILRSLKEGPQLPLGYPGSILLALVPPVWCSVMDKRLIQH